MKQITELSAEPKQTIRVLLPNKELLRLDLEFMHGQAVALRGGADEAFVEGDVRAQAGDFLVTLGQRALQVGIGLAADLVRALEGGGFLLQCVDALRLLVQAIPRIGRLRAERSPQTPATEDECGEDQQGECHPRMAAAGDETWRYEVLHGRGIALALSLRQAALPYRLGP